MLLRDGRLGAISDDVLMYISSREADKRIFKADLLVDRAHLIMLKEQGLICSEDCSRIIDALDSIDEPSLGDGEDIHEAIEALVISSVGEIGGRMHMARSRNDEVATCIRLALREQMLDLMEELIHFIKTLSELAERHTETIIPGYTHTQAAQPTTLAHHLMAHADAFCRDLDRLKDAYKRVNLSPLGGAAFASTGFEINRERTCQLLGFDGLVENSMDAVSTRDFILETLADLSILMVNSSRVAEELVLWSTAEFGYVELDDLFASTSSIMPQKKNPDTAELARAKAGSVIGSLVSAMTICKGLPMSYNRDMQEVTPHLWRSIDWARSTVRILDGCLSSAKYNAERLEGRSGAGFSTATELADSLVRTIGLPFRTAHRIVGKLASQKERPTIQDLDAAAFEVGKIRPSQLGFTPEMLSSALDPKASIQLRSGIGGPAPSETKRMASNRLAKVAGELRQISETRSRAAGALEALKMMR
jgi:argininosuccinate lyase